MPLSRRTLVGLCLVVVAVLASWPGAGWTALPSPAAAVSCPADVLVLGADLGSAQRQEVLATLGTAPSQASLLESIDDERRQAEGLVPPELLGVVAISSARLTRLPA